MTVQTINLQLPPSLYQGIQKRAAKLNRSVEDELIATVESMLAISDDLVGLPLDIAEQVKQLSVLDDHHLWQAAQRIVPNEKSERMQELIFKQQAEGLTESEQEEAKQLQHFANRVMMVRAEAAVLLKRRGVDVMGLRQPLSN